MSTLERKTAERKQRPTQETHGKSGFKGAIEKRMQGEGTRRRGRKSDERHTGSKKRKERLFATHQSLYPLNAGARLAEIEPERK